MSDSIQREKKSQVVEWSENPDPVEAYLKELGRPLTRENWLHVNYLFTPMPEPWTQEDENELPPQLQRPVEPMT